MARHIAGFAVLSAVALLATACASSSSPAAAGSGSSGSPSAPGSSTLGPPSGPATSPAASAHVAGVPPCPTSQLTVTLGASQGTAGSVIETLDFTNNGSSDCTLFGYPGVSLQGGSPAAQIGAAAARNGVTPASLVTLAPGAVANASLQVTVAGNYPAATCNPVPATSLLIYPPGQTVAASVAYSTTGCSATSVALLHVSAVQAGAGSAG